MLKLLPCPFCSNIPTIEKNQGYFFIECRCNIHINTKFTETPEHAANLWNKRKDPLREFLYERTGGESLGDTLIKYARMEPILMRQRHKHKTPEKTMSRQWQEWLKQTGETLKNFRGT